MSMGIFRGGGWVAGWHGGEGEIASTPDVYEVIVLKNVKIIIVGDRKNFNYKKAAAYGSPVAVTRIRGRQVAGTAGRQDIVHRREPAEHYRQA
jgi:hypothetical protein